MILLQPDIGHYFTVIFVTGVLPLGNMYVLLSSTYPSLRPIPCRIGVEPKVIKVGIHFIQPNPKVIKIGSHTELK